MSAVLVDTQALLWWLSDDSRLGRGARDVMATGDLLISAASLWEIAIKSGLGKLDADVAQVAQAADAGGMRRLPIGDAHLTMLQGLPREDGHGDPFDRMLVAQAMVEEVPILTADTKLSAYPISVLPARN